MRTERQIEKGLDLQLISQVRKVLNTERKITRSQESKDTKTKVKAT